MEKKFYPCQQLVVALDAKSLKALVYICNWQSQGSMKYYPTAFKKAMKMEEEDAELCLQTLLDANLLNVNEDDGVYSFSVNGVQMEKYMKLPIRDVLDGNGIPTAKTISWKSTPKKSSSIDDMSDKDLKTLLLRIQATLNEREQVKEKVVNLPNDLPF